MEKPKLKSRKIAKRKAALLNKDGNARKKRRSDKKTEENKVLEKENEEATNDQLN